MPFIPHTDDDTREMLEAIGAETLDDLFDEMAALAKIVQRHVIVAVRIEVVSQHVNRDRRADNGTGEVGQRVRIDVRPAGQVEPRVEVQVESELAAGVGLEAVERG